MYAARLAVFATAAVMAGTALTGVASPALAATRPTLTGPATTTGYGPVTLTGTARAGATVTLIEAAYLFRGDMAPAVPYFEDDIVSATADGSGRFTLRRRMDSGFVFAAEADGLRSEVLAIRMVARPSLELGVAESSVTVNVSADPAQPWLPVAVQRQNGATWTTVAEGATLDNGVYRTTLTGQPAGVQHYRAEVGPDPLNAILLGRSATVAVTVGSAEGTPAPAPTTPAPTTPAPTTPAPTTPAPTPSVPTPTPAPPAGPKTGDVLFTLVQYNSPGADTNTTKSLNGEYFRLTNRTKKTINLKYWTVKDRSGHTYTFGTFALTAGHSVTVATGKGTNGKPAGRRYWGRGGHVWNNTGDGAYLRSSAGKVIDTCGWKEGSGRTSC